MGYQYHPDDMHIFRAVTSSLASIEKRRGQQCAAALLRDIMSQWTRGNRGKQGDWRTE